MFSTMVNFPKRIAAENGLMKFPCVVLLLSFLSATYSFSLPHSSPSCEKCFTFTHNIPVSTY